jgi:hypothetical protein
MVPYCIEAREIEHLHCSIVRAREQKLSLSFIFVLIQAFRGKKQNSIDQRTVMGQSVKHLTRSEVPDNQIGVVTTRYYEPIAWTYVDVSDEVLMPVERRLERQGVSIPHF